MAANAHNSEQGQVDTKLAKQLEEWRRLLLDTSKRSRLINSKFGRGGALMIEYPALFQLWDSLAVNGQRAEFPWPSALIEIGSTEESAPNEDLLVDGTLSPIQLQELKQSAALKAGWVLTNLADKPLDRRL